MEEIKMSVNGIGTTGYPVTGYQTRRTGNNAADKSFAGSMGNVKSTGNTGFTLHISNEEDGQSIGAMADHDSSVTVYKTKDFDPANPMYKVKIWDAAGNVTERMVDISKVDPKNCDEIDMFAYSSHLSASGECPNAQSSFIRAGANQHGFDDKTYDDLFGMTDWIGVLKDAMQIQYNAGNLKGYLDYKQFWDFLDK